MRSANAPPQRQKPRPTRSTRDALTGCIRSCLPDPGSLPVNCAKAEEGYEFAGEDGSGNIKYSHWLNGSFTIVRAGYPPREDVTVIPDEDMVSLSASMWW